MGKKGLARGYSPAPAMYGGAGATERYRPRTPAETVDDGYAAVVEVASLNTVTHMSYESIRTVTSHRDRLLEAHPELEPELNAIGFNHIQCLLEIQRQVADNVKREK